jgi:PIN domain nuclease of toxin-antitoxin system
VKYLLDTNVLLHSIVSQPKLNASALRVLADPSSELYLSPVSSWEMAIKASIGKLRLPEPSSRVVARAMSSMSLRSVDVTHAHAFALENLPAYHQDPFDRLLIAQAIIEQFVLMTADHIFERYQVQIFFVGNR